MRGFLQIASPRSPHLHITHPHCFSNPFWYLPENPVFPNPSKEDCVVKLRLRDNESVQEAVKRFRKLVEHAGIKKEMRRREYYEKPSDQRRRARRRAERRARIARLSGM
jgi:small subunit ribosomal protein S21